MVSQGLWIAIAVIAVLVVAAIVIGLVRYRRRQISLRRSPEVATPIDRSGGYTASSGISFTQSSATTATGLPGVGDDAAVPRDSVKRPISEVRLPETPVVPAEPVVTTPTAEPAAPDISAIEPNFASDRWPYSYHQTCQRGLSRCGGSNNTDNLARRNSETYLF